MANLKWQSNDQLNLVDAQPFPWGRILYPLLTFVLLAILGTGYWIYDLQARESREDQARSAFLQATTPEATLKLAQQFAGTDQAALALLHLAETNHAKKDFAGSLKALDQFAQEYPHHELLTSAQLARAAALDASGKIEEAVTLYLSVAHQGTATPYAPYAYITVAKIYADQGKIAEERKALQDFQQLSIKSSFGQEVDVMLKKLPPVVPAIILPSTNK